MIQMHSPWRLSDATAPLDRATSAPAAVSRLSSSRTARTEERLAIDANRADSTASRRARLSAEEASPRSSAYYDFLSYPPTDPALGDTSRALAVRS